MEDPGIRNVGVFLGEYTWAIEDSIVDVPFSISLIEDIPSEDCGDFFQARLRMLKSGGLMLHAIDLYVGATEERPQPARIDMDRGWGDDETVRRSARCPRSRHCLSRG